MKAAIYQGNKVFTVEEINNVPLKSDEVSIQVAYCGICGTDRHIYHGLMDARVSPPQIIGHEMSGVISAVGNQVQDISIGDLVVVRPLDNRQEKISDRGYSHICKQLKFIGIDSIGAMQEVWHVPAFTIHKIPPSIDLKLAALIEPLAVACHDIKRGKVREGETVVVIGGGPIGILIAMVAKYKGAQVVVLEINESRLQLVEKMGCIPLNPNTMNVEQEILQITNDIGADVVFEVSGSTSGVKMMTDITAIRGRIVMVAIHSNPRETNLFQFFWKELELVGARVYEPHDYDEAIDMVNRKLLSLEPLITNVFPLEKVQEAFEFLDNNEDSMKVIIQCDNKI